MVDLKFADSGFSECKSYKICTNNQSHYIHFVHRTVLVYCQSQNCQWGSTFKALVDEKKIIITKSTVRRDIQLEDAEGVDCLPNSTIFEQLTLMGYEKISQKLTFYKAFFSPQWKFLIHTILQCLSSKTTAWNEFSSTMASAIICLATNQKFNISKYIFESKVKNLDNVGKFLMYLRFIQVFLDKQLEGIPTHDRIYIAPSQTKKIFENIRRVGKGFSGRETPLFQTMVVQSQAEMGEGLANPTDTYHTPTFIQPSTSQHQKKQKLRKPKRKDTQIPQSSGPTEHVADEAIYKELDDSLVRAATTASSLEGKQDSGNIAKTRSKATPNKSSSLGTTLGGGPRRQETIGDTIAQTRFKNVSKPMIHCSQETKTTQVEEIVSLKRRVNKLKQKKRSRTNGLKRLYKVGLTRVESSRDEESLEQEVATKDVNLTVDEVTLAQALVALKSVNLKVKVIVVEESSVPVSAASTKVSAATTTTTATIPTPRKGIVITELDQLKLDEEMALKLQAEIDEDERLAREKEEPNVALTKGWDDIHAKVDADYQLAQRLQAEEQEQFTTEQKATLFKELLKQRRKQFAAKRVEENMNKPPTKAQQTKTMITYLKNMEGWKHKDLKSKDFDSIKELFDKAFKRLNMFVDYRTDLVEEIAEVDDEQEAAKIKELMKFIPDEEEVAIDAIPLATKPLTIDATYAYSHAGRKEIPLTPATITDMLNKKLQANHFSEMFRGGLLGLKAFLMLFGITTVLIDVNVAQSKLVLLKKFNENYSKCLRLLVNLLLLEEVTTARGSYYCYWKLLLLVEVKTA
ncbi:hypothetical protein Tco_0530189 [Tanacetum coccineum]